MKMHLKATEHKKNHAAQLIVPLKNGKDARERSFDPAESSASTSFKKIAGFRPAQNKTYKRMPHKRALQKIPVAISSLKRVEALLPSTIIQKKLKLSSTYTANQNLFAWQKCRVLIAPI